MPAKKASRTKAKSSKAKAETFPTFKVQPNAGYQTSVDGKLIVVKTGDSESYTAKNALEVRALKEGFGLRPIKAGGAK